MALTFGIATVAAILVVVVNEKVIKGSEDEEETKPAGTGG